MTCKEFFKSTSFKCIITLLCVLLVSGIFLTIMNAFLLVTDEERFERAINKIYGKSVRTESVAVADYNDNATIEEAYRIKDDGNYLIKSTGKGGFENGTVTCWVVVNVSGGTIKGIDKVVIDSNKGQSYISNINDKFLSGFYSSYTSGSYYSPSDSSFIKTGATRSATAICNAVNGAIDFVNALFGNVTEDIYADFEYTTYIDNRNTSHEIVNGNVVFHIKTGSYGNAAEFTIDITVGADGKIIAYAIAEDGNGSTGGFESTMKSEILDGSLFVGKDLTGITALINEGMDYSNISSELQTGSSQSNYLCTYAAAFAAANYDKCLEASDVTGDKTDGETGNETDGGEDMDNSDNSDEGGEENE